MAQITTNVDDLTGETLPADNPTTRLFIEDERGDVSIEIDLSDTSFKALQKVLTKYVEKGRPYVSPLDRKRSTGTTDASEAKLARAWAIAERPDLNVKERGAVPQAAIEAYRDHLLSIEEKEVAADLPNSEK